MILSKIKKSKKKVSSQDPEALWSLLTYILQLLPIDLWGTPAGSRLANSLLQQPLGRLSRMWRPLSQHHIIILTQWDGWTPRLLTRAQGCSSVSETWLVHGILPLPYLGIQWCCRLASWSLVSTYCTYLLNVQYNTFLGNWFEPMLGR